MSEFGIVEIFTVSRYCNDQMSWVVKEKFCSYQEAYDFINHYCHTGSYKIDKTFEK